MEALKEVVVYTDGACDPNPGPGGYGVVLIYGKSQKEISAGYRLTTNNRMELMASIVGLEALKEPCRVKLFSDSEYLVKAIKLNWITRWKKKNWNKVKNPDLWKRLLKQTDRHEVEFIWVKGHAGIAYNERCDALALQASKSKNLAIDEYYEALAKKNKEKDE